MARTEWDELAKELGYLDWKDCLTQLYAEMSIAQISKRIGISTTAVVNHLQKFDIKTRKKGGANGNASQKYKLYLIDQRIIFTSTLNELTKLTGASKSVCFHYRSTLGGANGVLHNQPSERTVPIFESQPRALGAAAGAEQTVSRVLPANEG